jgi:hypothetical protein
MASIDSRVATPTWQFSRRRPSPAGRGPNLWSRAKRHKPHRPPFRCHFVFPTSRVFAPALRLRVLLFAAGDRQRRKSREKILFSNKRCPWRLVKVSEPSTKAGEESADLGQEMADSGGKPTHPAINHCHNQPDSAAKIRSRDFAFFLPHPANTMLNSERPSTDSRPEEKCGGMAMNGRSARPSAAISRHQNAG